MKFNSTTILGILGILITSTVLFLDMHYHFNSETYGFELTTTEVFIGYSVSAILIILPENWLIHTIKKIVGKRA